MSVTTILIVFSVYASQSNTSFSQEFDNPAACQAARQQIADHVVATSFHPTKSLVICVPKMVRQ